MCLNVGLVREVKMGSVTVMIIFKTGLIIDVSKINVRPTIVV